MSKEIQLPEDEELLLPNEFADVKLQPHQPSLFHRKFRSPWLLLIIGFCLSLLAGWTWLGPAPRDDPQVPLPGPTVTPNPNQLRLDPTWDVNAPPQTRVFDWTISKMEGSPDGFTRPMLAVNGQFPGPLVEANMGDTILVRVTNNLDEGTSIHWHGLDQNGTVFMDGLVGVNQCPIEKYGGSFQYEFKVPNQFGTFWWHSHYSVQYTEGISGPLIIHSPADPLKQGVDYDVDQLIILDDWWRDDAEYIAAQLAIGNYTDYNVSPPVKAGGAAPAPDSGLINGVGVFNCSYIAKNCTNPDPLEIQVEPGQRVRLRLLNMGSHAQQRFSVDEHPLQIIEADSNPVAGPTEHRVPLHDGQRYSVILNATVGKDGDAYWIRSYFGLDCFADQLGGTLTTPTLAVLRYVAQGKQPSKQLPASADWLDETTGGSCTDLNATLFTPLIPEKPPAAAQAALFNIQLNTRFLINGTTYINTPYDSILYSIYNKQPINASEVTTATFNSVAATDLIFNNENPIDHPLHLHGVDFWIIGSGSGNITMEQASKLNYTDNPLRRDVVVIPATSWLVLRIITNDPGVWGIHCHIAWHLAEGFLAAIIVQPEEILALRPPNAWTQDCKDGPATTTIPGKRSIETPLYRRNNLLGLSTR